jgi:preprotein translocase subunit SecY
MTVLTLTTGTMVLMWIGEQITDKGIGNGVSLVITVGIVAKLPAALIAGVQKLFGTGGAQPIAGGPVWLILMLVFLFGVVAATIAITQAQRKVTINYAKQVRGMKMTGGGTSYLPLKVNYAGVMPIIFAQAIFLFPSFLVSLFPSSPFVNSLVHELTQGITHYVIYAGMILFFSYFWVATQFNPVQIADDLKKNGGFIPGVRPGESTSNYLEFAMTRLTLAGAIFLTIIAILPNMVNLGLQIPYVTASFFGGTSLLIMVGVMLDTMRQMETHLLQRHYDGFLKKGKLRGRATTAPVATGTGLDDQSMLMIYVAFAVLIIAGVSVAYFFKV